MKILIGLGNPGKKYANSRHNIGKQALMFLAASLNGKLENVNGFQEFVFKRQGIEGVLIVTESYMNVSGPVISKIVNEFQTDVSKDLLILVDDVYLPFGKIRFRSSGSSGGHNGLQSIIEALETEDFARIRVGIGNPDKEVDLKEYVLDDFLKDEARELANVLENTKNCALSWMIDSPDKVMQNYN